MKINVLDTLSIKLLVRSAVTLCWMLIKTKNMYNGKKNLKYNNLRFSKICFGSRKTLPVTSLRPTKSNNRKDSNGPTDITQIVFYWPPREVNLNVYRPCICCNQMLYCTHTRIIQTMRKGILEAFVNSN